MLIIGCDFHPGFQQVAIFDNLTGEIQEKRLQHRAEAEQFYRGLAGQEVRVGMEACGHYPWFERLLAELGFELWFGDAAKVRASVVRKQKRTAMRNTCWIYCARIGFRRSGCRVWKCGTCAVAGASPQAGAGADADEKPAASHGVEPGVQKKYQLWTKAGRRSWSSCPCCRMRPSGESNCCNRSTDWKRRSANWTGGWRTKRAAAGGGAADDASGSRSGNRLSHGADLGTGRPIRIGQASGQLLRPDSQRRFQRRKTAAAGSANRAVRFCAFCSVEAGQTAARLDPQLKRFYRRLAARKNRSVAKVAVARKLATRCT